MGVFFNIAFCIGVLIQCTHAFTAVCVCVRSRAIETSITATPLISILIPSFRKTTTTEDDAHLYVAIDSDDTFWLKRVKVIESIGKVVIVNKTSLDGRIPFNEITQRAQDDGAEYIVRVNDDTEFVTSGWVQIAKDELRKMDPPNVGVVVDTRDIYNVVQMQQNDIELNSNVIVLVLSARDNFNKRQVIRETWGHNYKNVVFIIGQPCLIPIEHRLPYECANNPLKKIPSNITQYNYDKEVENNNAQIKIEAALYGDVSILPFVDHYRGLPEKMAWAFFWSLSTNAKWMVKIDDDCIARINNIESYVSALHDPMTVTGRIAKGWKVPRSGKWAEPIYYKDTTYPSFPIGSTGYIISREVSAEISRYKMHFYQGEDVSFGIWSRDLNIPIKWINSDKFIISRNCHDNSKLIFGHDFTENNVRSCFPLYSLMKAPIGRLGNLLFQIASLQGLASSHSMKPCILGNSISTIIETSVTQCPASIQPIKTLNEKGRYAAFNNFKFNGNTRIDGYLQSYKYFNPSLRETFKFKTDLMKMAKTYLMPWDHKTTVGIHVRHKHGEPYLNFPSNEYFINAMDTYRRKYQNVHFIVISDDPFWCQSNTVFQTTDVTVNTAVHNPAVDMAILSKCKHIILTIGSFGWWAAFLGPDYTGGDVIYYKDAFKMEHPTNKGNVVIKDYYPANWIGVNNRNLIETYDGTPTTDVRQESMKSSLLTIFSDDKMMKSGTWDGSPIIIEKYKLIFWTIPKNACEEFKKLFRRMEGFDNWKTSYNFPKGYSHHGAATTLPHNPAINGLTYLFNLNIMKVNTIMNDPTWTKATFLRNPLERFLSAYIDKIKLRPYHGKLLNLTFMEFITKVGNGWKDPHWNAQCNLLDCNKWLLHMDFIGNFETLETDTMSLLKKVGAWEKFGKSGWGKDGTKSIFQTNTNLNHLTNSKKLYDTYYNTEYIKLAVSRLLKKDTNLFFSGRKKTCTPLISKTFTQVTTRFPSTNVQSYNCSKMGYSFSFPRGNRCYYGYTAQLYDRFKTITTCNIYIDVGANWGQTALPLIKNGWRVISFEPVFNTALGAAYNLYQNDISHDRGIIIPAAISNNTGTSTIYLPGDRDDNSAISSIAANLNIQKKLKKIQINTTRMDDFLSSVDQNILNDVKLIKLDAQGHELLALKGFGNLLGMYNFTFIIENDVNIQKAAKFTINAVEQYLSHYNYVSYCFLPNGKFVKSRACYDNIYMKR